GPWRSGSPGICPTGETGGEASGGPPSPNPCNLRAKTLSERMKERYPAARIVGIALKDRAAILPAGKRADAAYWLKENEDDTAEFVCGAYYPGCRPEVLSFSREQGIAEKPASPGSERLFQTHPEWRQWSCSLPPACEQACPDDVAAAHEEDAGLGRDFPHPIGSAVALVNSPYGDDLLEGLAE